MKATCLIVSKNVNDSVTVNKNYIIFLNWIQILCLCVYNINGVQLPDFMMPAVGATRVGFDLCTTATRGKVYCNKPVAENCDATGTVVSIQFASLWFFWFFEIKFLLTRNVFFLVLLKLQKFVHRMSIAMMFSPIHTWIILAQPSVVKLKDRKKVDKLFQKEEQRCYVDRQQVRLLIFTALKLVSFPIQKTVKREKFSRLHSYFDMHSYDF